MPNDPKPMTKLTPSMQRFVLHWGEMGTRWGVNRAVAQIHALLMLSEAPLDAEEIANTLGLARSTVSTALKELEGWRLVKGSHILGDRREYYSTLDDVYEMARVIAAERRRREFDPTVAVLRETVASLDAGAESDYTRRRLEELLGFVEGLTTLHDQVGKLPNSALRRLLAMPKSLLALLGGGR